MELGESLIDSVIREVREESGAESTDIRCVNPSELDDLPIHKTQRLRLTHFFERRDQPYLG